MNQQDWFIDGDGLLDGTKTGGTDWIDPNPDPVPIFLRAKTGG